MQAIYSIMKLAVTETHHARNSLSGRTISTVQDLSYNISLAYAKYFQQLLSEAGSRHSNLTELLSIVSDTSCESDGDSVDPANTRPVSFH